MSNTYTESPWSLTDLYKGFDDPQIEKDMTALEAKVIEMEEYRGQCNDDITASTLNAIIKLNEETMVLFYKLGGFGRLSFAENTANQTAQAFFAQVSQKAAQLANRTLFFSLWWKELDDAIAQPLIAQAGDASYWLQDIRNAKPFTLSELEEKVLNLKNVNGRQAFDTLYDTIVSRYKYIIEIDGDLTEINREQLQSYYRSPDPKMREAAYRELYRVYGNESPILGQIYQYIVRDWQTENVELRGYATPISVRNRANDVPDEVVDTMLKVLRKNAPIFHEYFKLKAQWMGVDKLRRYDLYAPMAETEVSYTFDEAVNLVLESFNEFDPRIAQLAERVFTDGHYDSEIREGKTGGAFCSTLGPHLTPWVLQSYNGKPDDVATMAHELGHAIHSMLAEHHTILTQHSCLPLAETASTFGEMLLLDKLTASDPNPDLQRELLFSTMDDNYATVMRQGFFALFEVEAHTAILNGASVDEVSEMYLSLLKEQFGDSIEVSDDFKYEWVAIPHFYGTPFYVYAYAFGQLLALSLYRRYKEEGNAMIPGYVELLGAGGSLPPVEILKRAGIDPYSEAFWQGGFDVIQNQLDQIKALQLPM